MEKFWVLILVAFFGSNSLDKAESVKVKLEETPLKTFDEIFGEGWWDKDEAEDLKMPPTWTKCPSPIIRQNTQLGQIEPNSTDQNPPFTESDHSANAKNGEEQSQIMEEMTSNENIAEVERRRKIIDKFHAIKEELKQKGKFSTKEWNQIDNKIAKHLTVNRSKIYEWKKEFGLSRKMHNFKKKKNEQKNLVEKFDQMKAELMRAGFKNSYKHEINETVAKELGISDTTIYNWKRKLGQTTPQHKHSHSEQKELMKRYYEIKDQNPKNRDEDIAKMLKIGIATLYNWKKQFKRQHPNSVEGQSLEENAAKC